MFRPLTPHIVGLQWFSGIPLNLLSLSLSHLNM